MRRHLFAAFVLIPAAGLLAAHAGLFTASRPALAQARPVAPSAQPCDSRCEAKWLDANLRLDQTQVVGTAKSAKQRPSQALLRLSNLLVEV